MLHNRIPTFEFSRIRREISIVVEKLQSQALGWWRCPVQSDRVDPACQDTWKMEKGRDICFNFNQICRFCLSQGGVMSAIFADSGQEITSLPTKIMSCVSIQVSVVFPFHRLKLKGMCRVVWGGGFCCYPFYGVT